MSTQGKGTYVINSGWSEGSLVFYEKAVGRTVTGDIFTIGASQVTVGGTGQDVDFLVYLGGASNYFKLDCGAKTAAFYGVDVTVTGDLTIATEDLALGDNCSLEFGDSTDVLITWDTSNLTIIPATDDTGEIQIGNDGTKSMNVRFYGATANYGVLWDMNGDTNGSWNFGANTYGLMVNLYGITTGCGVFWDPDGDSNNGTLSVGASGGSKGVDLYAYGTTNGNYLQWDQSANKLQLVGTSTVLSVAGTTASSSTSTGAVIISGGVGIAGAVFGTTIGLSGALTVTPTAAGTFLDFVLETEWVSGTLINADFGSATTLTGAVVGVNLDIGANIVATSEQSVKAIDINLPQMTVDAASPTVKGIEITAQGAIVQTTSGTTTWNGIDVTMPATTQTAGTVTVNGIIVTSGTVTSGTQNCINIASTASSNGIAFTGTVAKGINFAGATPAHADADDAFVAIGTWNDPLVITTQAYHFVPIQVNLRSDTSINADIAAARFRVNTSTSTANTLTAVNVLELRSALYTNVASHANLQVSTTISDAVQVQTGEALVAYFAFDGAAAMTNIGANPNIAVAEFKVNNTATTLTDAVIIEAVNSSTVGNMLRIKTNSATVTDGIEISGDMTTAISIEAGTITTGISIPSTCTTGISVASPIVSTSTITQTIAALGNDARGASFKFTQATPAVSDGYAAFEIETTVSGIATGMHSALSSWVNISGSGAMGANLVAAQQNGIWADAGSNTGSIVIFGMRAQAILTDAPTVLAPFSLNTSNREITALFEMNSNPDVGYQANANETSPKVGDVPLFCDAAGQQYFVRIYSARG
ncbi:MAG: hypothetical protein PHI12_08825 [Dehalococcoidales bacterium]|nr:hypothetical protein [Dehalococcoidales bacterium]